MSVTFLPGHYPTDGSSEVLLGGIKVAGEARRAATLEGFDPTAGNTTGDSGFGVSNSATWPKDCRLPLCFGKLEGLPASSLIPTPKSQATPPPHTPALTLVYHLDLGAREGPHGPSPAGVSWQCPKSHCLVDSYS